MKLIPLSVGIISSGSLKEINVSDYLIEFIQMKLSFRVFSLRQFT